MPFPKNPLIAKFFIQLGRVDELGSGVINVYRYLKDYSPGRAPMFLEDKLFKTIIPVGNVSSDDGRPLFVPDATVANDKINEPISTKLLQRLADELREINRANFVTLDNVVNKFTITVQTARRDMKFLRDAELVILVGSRKTSRYTLTDEAKMLFGENGHINQSESMPLSFGSSTIPNQIGNRVKSFKISRLQTDEND